MDQEKILSDAKIFASQKLEGRESGHGFYHALRVENLAETIAQKEGGDVFVVKIAALLHDVDDWKFSQENQTQNWLNDQEIEKETIDHVLDIIKNLSFKGAGVDTSMKTLEGQIVQDADRLDAIGAIGIARAFSYGGHANREMYNPDQKPEIHQSYDDYKTKQSHTINHFYEKLLLLKDRMNTKTAKELALGRHKYMEQFLEEFFQEWKGEK